MLFLKKLIKETKKKRAHNERKKKISSLHITFYSAISTLSLTPGKSGLFGSIAFRRNSATCCISFSFRSRVAPVRILVTSVILICPLKEITSRVHTFGTPVKLSSFIGAIFMNCQPKKKKRKYFYIHYRHSEAVNPRYLIGSLIIDTN